MSYSEFSLNLWGKETKTGTEVWGIYVFVACLKVGSGNKIDFDHKKIWNRTKLKVKLGFIQMYPGFAKIVSKLYTQRK